MKRYVHTTIKMTLASIITILITELVGLEYAITGGILAVLSIQLTRKDSYMIAFKRLIGASIALVLATLMFVSFGYTVWIFALFTVFFIALSFAVKVPEGIVPSLVLVSHLLLHGSYALPLVINGFLLITIAILVALGLNLLYPLNIDASMGKTKREIDAFIVVDLQLIAGVLKDNHTKNDALKSHQFIYQKLGKLLKEAELVDKDILFDKDHLAMSYLKMRHSQMNRLNRIFELLIGLEKQHPNAVILSEYFESLSQDIGEIDKANPQLNALRELLEFFRAKPLPKSREEFEIRAVLFQITSELESFLKEKIAFHKRYS
ncbi:aromatic acid exporter family protein [Liberiplasma polymorphum]|uniref:aromatic acid exporter family protein n=1 Tax=Liberiplasma polymorphum TaxID=3374570 RepID=UPI003771A20E